jgi:4-amino-4-deoxychorismate mutase
MTQTELARADALLQPYRDALDACDAVLLDCLRDRMRIIAEVSEVKRRHSIAVMQSGRVAQIEARLTRYAEAHGLSADFLHAIYRTIIAEACQIEHHHIAEPYTRTPS